MLILYTSTKWRSVTTLTSNKHNTGITVHCGVFKYRQVLTVRSYLLYLHSSIHRFLTIQFPEFDSRDRYKRSLICFEAGLLKNVNHFIWNQCISHPNVCRSHVLCIDKRHFIRPHLVIEEGLNQKRRQRSSRRTGGQNPCRASCFAWVYLKQTVESTVPLAALAVLPRSL